jgi:hypothetical protein
MLGVGSELLTLYSMSFLIFNLISFFDKYNYNNLIIVFLIVILLFLDQLEVWISEPNSIYYRLKYGYHDGCYDKEYNDIISRFLYEPNISSIRIKEHSLLIVTKDGHIFCIGKDGNKFNTATIFHDPRTNREYRYTYLRPSYKNLCKMRDMLKIKSGRVKG